MNKELAEEFRSCPSALRRQAEQQERDLQITDALDGIWDAVAAEQRLGVATTNADAMHRLLWDLQAAIAQLNSEGLLRRNGDIECLRRWIAVASCRVANSVKSN